VIELLGIGVPRETGGWLFRHVCATLEAGEVTVVVSPDAEARRALLDALTGRRVPDEGRVWVSRAPVMPGSRRRIRRLCGEVDSQTQLARRRSLFWNAVAPSRDLARSDGSCGCRGGGSARLSWPPSTAWVSAAGRTSRSRGCPRSIACDS
jgi:hypothetical protein